MVSQAEALAHRRDLIALTNLANADLATLWRRFGTVDAARDGLLEMLPQFVATYGAAAATLGADWYDDMRADASPGGRFRADPAIPRDDMGAEVLARWGIGPLFKEQPDWVTSLTLLTGGLQRRIANVDRDTITTSSVRDPRARGWARGGTGNCDFCAMLIGRGTVYTEASADFQSHDHCGCVAVPDFG